MLKLTQLVLLLLLFSLSASSVSFATPDPQVVSHCPLSPGWELRDLSSEYRGIVDFTDESGTHKSGPAKLLIYGQGKEFILTHLRTKQEVKGKICTAVLTNKTRIGDIQLNNDSEIQIRWLLDKAKNRLMIGPPENNDQDRVFIFCPRDIAQAQCTEEARRK